MTIYFSEKDSLQTVNYFKIRTKPHAMICKQKAEILNDEDGFREDLLFYYNSLVRVITTNRVIVKEWIYWILLIRTRTIHDELTTY